MNNKCFRLLTLIFICSSAFILPTTAQQLSRVDSIRQGWIASAGDDSIHLERALDYGWELFFQGGDYLDTAKKVTHEAILLAQDMDHYVNELAAYNLLGTVYRVQAKKDSAHLFFDQAIQIAQENQDSLRLGKLIGNKGAMYLNEGSLDESLKLMLRAHAIFDDLQDSTSLALSYQSLASLFIDKQEYANAKPYGLKGYELYGEVLSKERQSYAASSLGAIYRNLGQLDSAEYYYLHTRQYGKNFAALWRDNESYLARLYEEQGEYDKAIQTLKSLVNISDMSSGDPRSQDYLTRLSIMFLGQDMLDSATYYYELIDFDRIKGNFQVEKLAYELEYKLNKAKGNYRRALQSHEALSAIQDSVFNIESEEKFDKILTEYETREKEQEIKLLSTQAQLQQSRLRASRISAIGLGVGMLILGGFLWRLYRLNIKVKKSADEKDTLLKEIHHRVKNNLQVISALLTLQSAHLNDAKAKAALRKGQDRVESMALIHKDLYQHDNLKGVNTREYFEELVNKLLQSYNLSEESVELIMNVDEILLDVDTMIPLGLMVNEMISNALKHAFTQDSSPQIKVALRESDRRLLLAIEDNGKGLSDIDILEKKSFGYSLIKSFARKLDADLSIDGSEGLKISATIKNYSKYDK